MNYDQTIDWLDGRLKRDSFLSALAGLFAFLGGGVIMAVTWGLIYMVCLYSMQGILGFSHWSYIVIPTAMMPLLFWGNAATSREYLSEYSVTTGTATNKVVVFYLPRIGMVSNINPLAPNTVHTMVKIITDCLYFGPRIVTSAFRY